MTDQKDIDLGDGRWLMRSGHEDGSWLAVIDMCPGVVGRGGTRGEAIDSLWSALLEKSRYLRAAARRIEGVAAVSRRQEIREASRASADAGASKPIIIGSGRPGEPTVRVVRLAWPITPGMRNPRWHASLSVCGEENVVEGFGQTRTEAVGVLMEAARVRVLNEPGSSHRHEIHAWLLGEAA